MRIAQPVVAMLAAAFAQRVSPTLSFGVAAAVALTVLAQQRRERREYVDADHALGNRLPVALARACAFRSNVRLDHAGPLRRAVPGRSRKMTSDDPVTSLSIFSRPVAGDPSARVRI
jgi:hypothetical protein